MATTLLETDKISCERCGREFKVKDFYKDKNGNPMKKCKKCMASMIDLNSYSTILPVLKEINIPYIPAEFESLKERYLFTEKNGQLVRNPNANQTILGKYIGKMKLLQFKDYNYEDTPKFVEAFEDKKSEQEEEVKKQIDELLAEGYNIESALALILHGKDEEDKKEEDDVLLTRAQIKELKIKWGSSYTEEELLQLETFYKEMHDSYEIVTASHEDYLKKIVRLSIRIDQAIEIADYEAVGKLSSNYDKFMKSAKFTASQKKEEEAYIDSFSEMSRLAEEVGFIPVYHTNEPQDIVDVTLRDLNNYTKNLIEKEPGLATLIEQAFEAIKQEEEKDRMAEDEDDSLFDKDFITDEDYFKDAEILTEDQWGDEADGDNDDNKG